MNDRHEPQNKAEALWKELSETAPARPERLTMAGAQVKRARSHGLRALLPAGTWRLTGLQRGLLGLCAALVVLLLLLSLLIVTALKPPKTSGSARIDGKYTFLLAGTDQDGLRTDTVMLAALDANAQTASVMSLPRDTLVLTDGEIMKLNALYAHGGTGRSGMEYLAGRITEMLGLPIDGYCLVSLDSFAAAVDLLGGVWFDVPMEMHYDDPWQDLHIDLSAGYQKLDGGQAVHLMRYRSGYYNADLGRVEVQRAFLTAMANQCLQAGSLPKLGSVLRTLSGELVTNLSTGTLSWLAMKLLRVNDITTHTMPGSADGIYLNGQNYYVIYGLDTLALINEFYNPTENTITLADVNMMRLSGKAIVYADGVYFASP